MARLLTGFGAALILALPGCGDETPEPGNQITVPGPADVQQRIETMPEGQRNAVFLRAIRDAGQDCQHVETSAPAGEHQGFPVWTATCDGGGTWTILIGNDGVAQILNAAEARLVDGNESAPANQQQAQ